MEITERTYDYLVSRVDRIFHRHCKILWEEYDKEIAKYANPEYTTLAKIHMILNGEAQLQKGLSCQPRTLSDPKDMLEFVTMVCDYPESDLQREKRLRDIETTKLRIAAVKRVVKHATRIKDQAILNGVDCNTPILLKEFEDRKFSIWDKPKESTGCGTGNCNCKKPKDKSDDRK